MRIWFESSINNQKSPIINHKRGELIKLLLKNSRVGLTITLFIFSHSQVWGYDWKYYGTNEDGSYFYDSESVTRFSGDHLRVYVQSIYTDKAISHWVKNGGKEFQNLDFSLILSEYNCADRSVRHLQILFYSTDERIFYPIKNDEWQLFVPDPMSGALFKELCK